MGYRGFRVLGFRFRDLRWKGLALIDVAAAVAVAAVGETYIYIYIHIHK